MSYLILYFLPPDFKTSHPTLQPYSLKILLNFGAKIGGNIYARVHFENRESEFEWELDFNVSNVESVTLVSFHKADFEQCQRWWKPASFLEAE